MVDLAIKSLSRGRTIDQGCSIAYVAEALHHWLAGETCVSGSRWQWLRHATGNALGSVSAPQAYYQNLWIAGLASCTLLGSAVCVAFLSHNVRDLGFQFGAFIFFCLGWVQVFPCDVLELPIAGIGGCTKT